MAATHVAAADEVTVLLRGNTTARGLVDTRTNSNRLWLRRAELGVQLLSGYAWSNVLQAEIDGEAVTVATLRGRVAALATPARPPHQVESFAGTLAEMPPGSSPLPPSGPLKVAVGRVKTLKITAYLDQWDDEPLPDGLTVEIVPLDAWGQLVPVRGELQLTLYGEARPLNMGVTQMLPPKYIELERSHALVRFDDFAAGPATYRLPFDRFQPERDVNVEWSALVRARLGVPGQGVFEASSADVAVRDFSRFRLHRQLDVQQRFMPFETDGLRPLRPVSP